MRRSCGRSCTTRENWRGVLRSKGFFWIAADHRVAYEWAQAGGVERRVARRACGGRRCPASSWGHPEGERPDTAADSWHPRFGDRAQQLVFIGQGLDEAAMRARLDACLLEKHLTDADSESWAKLPNPFPELELAEEPE